MTTRIGTLPAALTGVLIALAGAAIGGARVLRWGRCLGAPDGYACAEIQNHTFDSLLPTDPWVPVSGVAQLDGLAHLLIAVALLRGAAPYLRTAVGTVLLRTLVTLLVVVGGCTLASGLTGMTFAVNRPLEIVWLSAGTLLAGAVAVLVIVSPVSDRVKPLVVALPLTLAATMQEYFLFILFVDSFDTPPWTGSIRAVLLLVLGVAIAIVATRRPVPAAG